jgi:hypothetical protein
MKLKSKMSSGFDIPQDALDQLKMGDTSQTTLYCASPCILSPLLYLQGLL